MGLCAALAAGPASAVTFEEAVRSNLTLGLQLCVQHLPNVDGLRTALAQAGYEYAPEVFGPDDVLHWYYAPADTVSVAVIDAAGAEECRVNTGHLGVTAALQMVGTVLQDRFPGVFQYGNMENTPPITPDTMGDRWVDCTGYVGWYGQRAMVITLATQGNDPACIENGTVQISIRP